MNRSEYGAREFLQSEPDLSRIHRVALETDSEIKSLLEVAHLQGVTFEGGLGRDLDRERAHLVHVHDDSLSFAIENFDLRQREKVALTFRLNDLLYLMTAKIADSDEHDHLLRTRIPDALYNVERRERDRIPSGNSTRVPTSAMLRGDSLEIKAARVLDYSFDGVAIELPDSVANRLSKRLTLTFLDGKDAGTPQTAFPKNRRLVRSGWSQVGMQVTASAPGPLIQIERRTDILGGSRAQNRWRQIQLATGTVGAGTRRALNLVGVVRESKPDPEIVRFENDRGESIVALQDSWRAQPGAPVVLIPPAWAKTKETLLPLARTIVATFQRARRPVTVLRLDGIRRRGESHREPEFTAPGTECLGMTFSQGAADIKAALNFLSDSPDYAPETIILVTFSGAAIEARKVLAEEESDRVGGWVSVVGAADLSSGLRVLSGGQDYIGGFERGVRFGRQRVLGIDTNADLVCEDALNNQLAHLEDARRQMSKVATPITWIQGRDDAWIDPAKVREILSCGDSSRRRLIEVPTGHQLRTSREALEVFQLVSSEIGRFVLRRPLSPQLPDLADLEARRNAERARLLTPSVDLGDFWHQYLLGRGNLPGMELLTGTAPYREMMDTQIEALKLRRGDLVADLGSGIGTLAVRIGADSQAPRDVRIHEFDFLHAALDYSRARSSNQPIVNQVAHAQCDLGFSSSEHHIPVRENTYDAALLSLVVNYVEDPARLLREVRRILRKNGRVVLSALRPDTDISKIYIDAADEVRRVKAAGGLEELTSDDVEQALASCLNDAARLVDMEEQGLFQFWERDQLTQLVSDAGFRDLKVAPSFGRPPQAIVVSAVVAE